jgi:hypothetical protein
MKRSSQTASLKRHSVLLLGAGTGEATCGILYVASYLRRHGVEAYVRLNDFDETAEEMARTLAQLIKRVRPRIVGISLKWFHHVARAIEMATVLKQIDPEIEIAFGGNSATSWATPLLTFDCVDYVISGDGEEPMLALCTGNLSHPNILTRAPLTAPTKTPYVQGTKSEDIYYSHFNDIFLSQLDAHSFSGWVAPGKGCSENCLYCSGTRGLQKAIFGRAKPFLRPVASVQKDHAEIAGRTWQMRYDFAGSTAAFLEQTWSQVDLSKHSATYFLWGVPPKELAATLSKTFERVYMVLDIGCFSQQQRLEQMQRGLLKPCPTNAELFDVIEACEKHSNLQLEISGIAGLPFANHLTLGQEKKLVKQLLKAGKSIGYQRLEAQPGSLVTEHPERFEMKSEAQTFEQFLSFFQERALGDVGVPMVRYLNEKTENAVQETSDEIDELVWNTAAQKSHFGVHENSQLVNACVAREEFELGQWLGSHRVSPKVSHEGVTVLRSINGNGLSCAPSVPVSEFEDALLQQGHAASQVLSVLQAFERALPVKTAIAALRKSKKMNAETSNEIIEYLVQGAFLKAVT